MSVTLKRTVVGQDELTQKFRLAADALAGQRIGPDNLLYFDLTQMT